MLRNRVSPFEVKDGTPLTLAMHKEHKGSAQVVAVTPDGDYFNLGGSGWLGFVQHHVELNSAGETLPDLPAEHRIETNEEFAERWVAEEERERTRFVQQFRATQAREKEVTGEDAVEERDVKVEVALFNDDRTPKTRWKYGANELGEPAAEVVPATETKAIRLTVLKGDVRRDSDTGKYYRRLPPDEAEVEAAVEEKFKNRRPPEWAKELIEAMGSQ